MRLEITLHDGGFRGVVTLPYDSADETYITEARYSGAWKRSQFALSGKNAWYTVSLEWPDARLSHRCNDHDFRLELPQTGNVTIKEIRVIDLPPLPPPVKPMRMPLSPVRMTNVTADADMIRLPGRFVQEDDHPLVINAADATELNLTNGKHFGDDGTPAGGAYIHFVEQAHYRITVATPGQYQL